MKKYFFLLLLIIGGGFYNCQIVKAQSLAGRILLQVESKGEAWYYNPVNQKRYFLGRPDDAFNVMRSLGLGIKETDFSKIALAGKICGCDLSMNNRLGGRIIIRVEKKGEAWYLNPVDLKPYFLGRPADAFKVMRELGLGISNSNLNKISSNEVVANQPVYNNNNNNNNNNQVIPIASANAKIIDLAAARQITYSWPFEGKTYTIAAMFSHSLYKSYEQSPKSYQYVGSLPDNWHEAYYGMFLTLKPEDKVIAKIAQDIIALGKKNGLNNDQQAELIMSFVQSIPYDKEKSEKISEITSTTKPNYPFETLYLNKGVCSDKSFLAFLLIRSLGYGAVLIDYPEANHAAVGISCPKEYSIYNSGYCFAETTNLFPIGVIPKSVNNNNARNISLESLKGQFDQVFNPINLGKALFFQKTSGDIYQGMDVTYNRINKLKQLELDIAGFKPKMESLKNEVDKASQVVSELKKQLDIFGTAGNIEAYNNIVPQYNNAIKIYNAAYNNYKLQIDLYNIKVSQYNQSIKNFYKLI